MELVQITQSIGNEEKYRRLLTIDVLSSWGRSGDDAPQCLPNDAVIQLRTSEELKCGAPLYRAVDLYLGWP